MQFGGGCYIPLIELTQRLTHVAVAQSQFQTENKIDFTLFRDTRFKVNCQME